MDQLTFGKRLRQTMDGLGFSAPELATQAQVSERQLYRYLADEDSPSVEAAFRLSQALRVSIDYLLGNIESASRCPSCGGRLLHRGGNYWCEDCTFEGTAHDVEGDDDKEYRNVQQMWKDRMAPEVKGRKKGGGRTSGRKRGGKNKGHKIPPDVGTVF